MSTTFKSLITYFNLSLIGLQAYGSAQTFEFDLTQCGGDRVSVSSPAAVIKTWSSLTPNTVTDERFTRLWQTKSIYGSEDKPMTRADITGDASVARSRNPDYVTYVYDLDSDGIADVLLTRGGPWNPDQNVFGIDLDKTGDHIFQNSYVINAKGACDNTNSDWNRKPYVETIE